MVQNSTQTAAERIKCCVDDMQAMVSYQMLMLAGSPAEYSINELKRGQEDIIKDMDSEGRIIAAFDRNQKMRMAELESYAQAISALDNTDRAYFDVEASRKLLQKFEILAHQAYADLEKISAL